MKEQIKAKEPVNLYRMLSLVAITLDSIGVTFFLCARSRLYLDESLCLLFLDMLFVLIYVFELEYERNASFPIIRRQVLCVLRSFMLYAAF